MRQQLTAGRTDTSPFWADIAKSGTPIVDPFASDGKYQLVTFLWRGSPATRNVYVDGSMRFASLSPSDYMMRRLDQSDVWYLTLKIPAGARFSYRLSPNDRAVERDVTAQADPLNKRVWGCRPNSSKYVCSSMVELPGSVPQPWVAKMAGTLEGRIERRTIKSVIQSIDRPIAIYTPPGYRADGPPTSLVVLFDGDTYLSDEQAVSITVDNLIAASKISPTIVVFVMNVGGGEGRERDLVANEDFAEFVAKELVPWVRANYNVTGDAARTVVGGYSAGGLAAAFIGFRHSNVIGNVLSQSGAFWWESRMHLDNLDFDDVPEANVMAALYAQTPKLALKFYLDAGTFELGASGPFGILSQTRHLRDVLLAKGYAVQFQQFVGGHDGLSWRGTIADGLIALLGH